jgi:hypothetical protein
VPLGSYRIFVDIPNYGMDSVLQIAVTTADTVSNNNNYYVDSVMVRVDSTGGTGVHSFSDQQSTLLVFPNPAHNYLIVQSSTPIGKISIVNLLGETIATENETSVRAFVDLSGLTPGIYLLRAKGKYIRFVKE